MPIIGGSQNILSAEAGYSADDWADVGAAASLDLQATAALHRGGDLELGAEALVQLDGAVQKYLTADVSGEAHAAARIRAQIQVPLDLFSEAGLAIRLQAIAEAAAGVTLDLGLSVDDFLALAEADQHMRGVPLLLLRVFLKELEVSGGVMAKAAVSAMAYANVALTGRLLPSAGAKPGFTVAAEAGVGLSAGAGFLVQARFGVDDPRRLLRRSVDVCVEESLRAVAPALDPEVRWICGSLGVPAKIALRTAYELGLALAPSGAAASADGETVAVRCIQVALEEVQRHVLEWAVGRTADALRTALRDTGFTDRRWQDCHPQRQALGDRLAAIPPDPFEPTAQNRDYWLALVNEALAVAGALSADGTPSPASARLLATIWSATQLLFIAVGRISQGSARVSLLGRPPAQVSTPFDGDLSDPPPAVARSINASLGRAATARVTQREAVQMVLQTSVEALDGELPDWADLVMMVVGPRAHGAARALEVVFSNVGAFVPAADGRVSPGETLAVIRDGLRAYFDARVDAELRPALLALAADDRALGLYADEVLLASLRTVVHTVLDAVIRWAQGQPTPREPLRELCSSLVMSLFGRSLVVTGDVLLDQALRGLQRELRALAGHVNDRGGVAEKLAGITHLDRVFVAEVIEETLQIAADTFAPLPDERRAHIRDLLYRIIDTAPTTDDADPLGALGAEFIPNGEAAGELALLLGEEIGGNLVRFIQALLTRVGTLILEELLDAIADIGRAVEAWLAEVEELGRRAAERLAQLLGEIAQLGIALEEAGDRLLDKLSDLLRRLDAHAGSRTALRDAAREVAVGEALKALRSNDVYKALPRELRSPAEDAIEGAVGAVLQTGLLDPVLEAVAAVADEAADFLEDLRDLEPGTALPEEVLELFLDRLEDAVRDMFGGHDPRLDLSITVPVVNWEIDLGRVRLPLGRLVSGLRGCVRGLQGVRERVDAVADALAEAFSSEARLRGAEAEQQLVEDQQAAAARRLAEARLSALDVQILRPTPGGAEAGVLKLELALPGVPRAFVVPEDELDTERLFVWVNQKLLSLNDATVEDLGAPAVARPPGSLRPDVTAWSPVTHPMLLARVAPRAAPASPPRTGKVASAGRILRRPGAQAKNAGRLLGAGRLAPGGPALPGRTLRASELGALLPVATAGLRISVSVPAQRLHEGINTVVVVLAPGPATRRLERTVSFLWTAPPTAAPGTPVMPGRPSWDGAAMPDLARAALERRIGRAALAPAATAVPARPASPAAGGPGSGRASTGEWVLRPLFPLRADRRRAVEASRAELAGVLRAAPVRVRALHQAVAGGAFRPVAAPIRGEPA